MDAKVSIKAKTKTMPVQNLFRYISFKLHINNFLKPVSFEPNLEAKRSGKGGLISDFFSG